MVAISALFEKYQRCRIDCDKADSLRKTARYFMGSICERKYSEEAKMKKVVNLIIALLSLLCIIGTIKLSSLPLLPMFSASSFWYTPASVRESFALLYDIFVSFLLSAIFYFLVEVLPENLRLHRGKKLISNDVNILLKNMEQIVSITKQIFQIETDTPFSMDVVHINGNTAHAHEEVSYHTEIFEKNKKRKTCVRQAGEFDSIIKSCISTVEKQLQNIRRYDTFFASDVKFVEIITRIESCKFISYYKKERDKPVECFLFANSGDCFLDFYHLYTSLQKCNFHTEFSKTVIDTPEEALRYKERRNSGELLKIAALYQHNRTKAYEHENPIILCEDSEKEKNTIMLIHKFMPGSSVYSWNQIEPDLLKNSHLLIVLGTSKNLKISENELSAKIFFFIGKMIFIKTMNHPKQPENIEKVFYQKKLSILGFSIFSDHPTPGEISRLTSAIDNYIRDKYKLELTL